MESYSSSANKENHPSADLFHCSCGAQVSLTQISKHYSSWPDMKKKYGKLFGSIDKLITSESQDLQDWKSLEVLFKFLQGHIKMMINKEKK